MPNYTTTITVQRRTSSGETGYDQTLSSYGLADTVDQLAAPVVSSAYTGVRAHIGSPGGITGIKGQDPDTIRFHLTCEPIDLVASDVVIDERNGRQFEVVWALKRDEVPRLAHTTADVQMIRGDV